MLIPALVFTVAAAAQAAPSAADIGRAYDLFLEAQAQIDDGDLDDAASHLREVIRLLGEAPDVRAELASVAAQLGEITEAKAEAERALAADPDTRLAHRILGLILASEMQTGAASGGTVDAAIVHLERALADDADDVPADLTLADLYIRDARYDAAIARLQDLLLDRPGHPQATLMLARAYEAAGRVDEARSIVDAIGGGRRAGAEAAEALEGQGRWADAADAWARMVDAAPDVPRYRLRHAAALANAGALDEARAALREAADRWPDDTSAYFLLTQVELRAGRDTAAERAALRISEIDPADPRGPLALAEVRELRGDYHGVVDALEARVALADANDIESDAYGRMAGTLSRAYLGIGESGRAVATLETARAHAPDDLQLLFSLAATYEQTRAFDLAEQAFRDLLSADPSHAPGLNYLGYMLAERGTKLDEAVAFISRALDIDGDNPAYLDSLGWAYYKQARFDEALAPLEQAAGAVPRSSVIQEHLGDLYLKLGRFDDAEAAFGRALDGDRDGVDLPALERKLDEARSLRGPR